MDDEVGVGSKEDRDLEIVCVDEGRRRPGVKGRRRAPFKVGERRSRSSGT